VLVAVGTVPQLKVAPVVVDEAVMVMLVIAQVSVAGGAMLRLGGVVAWLTVVEAELVQPFEGSVTVTE
jgi:hypothetical protein